MFQFLKNKFYLVFVLLLFALPAASGPLKPNVKQTEILKLIETRQTELKDKLKDLQAMYNEGLVTLHDSEPYQRELKELENFEYTIKNPFKGSYEENLRVRLTSDLDKLQKDLEQKKALWEEGLIATKEIEAEEEKAALYNYLLDYLSDQSRFPVFAVGKGSWSIAAILGREYPIESRFGFRNDPINPGRKQFHAGVDFPAFTGTPVRAPFDGVVTKVVTSTMSGGGMQVRLSHGNDIQTVYMHLSKIYVVRGKAVKPGDVIALVGATGKRVTGPHLHFEIHLKGIPVDPLKYLLRPKSAAKAKTVAKKPVSRGKKLPKKTLKKKK
jgi:murein DD-endopeptidase MepM/ murein hydrolase activator NlpD